MSPTPKDHWTSQAYTSAAPFVPKLTTQVMSYLNIQPTDHILDIGCGDAQLTSQIAQTATSGNVLGVDSSKSFIATARENHSDIENLKFILHDATSLRSCRYFDENGGERKEVSLLNGKWDKVFSNAAMHWILGNEETRLQFFTDVYEALKVDGMLVFEMGGKGNVAEIQAAMLSSLVHVGGVSIEEARKSCPWFFPSTEWMKRVLEYVGFDVSVCEMEYRPTKLSGESGVEEWIRLMCAEWMEVVEEESKRESIVKEVSEIVESIMRREEDGSWWMGYVRLRVVARKKKYDRCREAIGCMGSS